MAKPPPRYVILDDTDPAFTYTGPGWFADSSGNNNNVGNFGAPYLNTLHGTSVNGSFSVSFNGTAFAIQGTNIVVNSSTNPDPTLECFVDGVSVGRDPAFFAGENNWGLCHKNGLSDGLHNVQVEVTVLNKTQTFWFDRFQYIPSPNMPLDNQVIMFENTDPAIQYDSQWRNWGDVQNVTTGKNSIAQVNFVGVSVTWLGFIPTELPHAGATASWHIDNGTATQFLMPGLPASATSSVYNQIYLQTSPPVEPGPHTLTVTFLGSDSTTPLALEYLLIQNGTFPSSSIPNSQGNGGPETSSPEGGGSSPSSDNNSTGSSTPLAAIIGGVLGGLAFLTILLAGFLYWRRRRAHRGVASPQESEYMPTPFDPYIHETDNMAQVQPGYISQPGTRNFSITDATPLVLESGARRKQQEAFGGRVSSSSHPAPVSSASGSSSASSSTPRTTNGTSSVRRHEDSGVRLIPVIEDVPPHYTPD